MSNENSISEYQLKVKVLRFMELSYKKNGNLTAALVRSKGRLTLKVDNKGKATLSGKVGRVKFSVNEEIRKFGFDLKYISIMFSGNSTGTIRYAATFSFMGFTDVSFRSTINVEQLILSCSGLLCLAARLYKANDKRITAVQKRIDKSLYHLSKNQ